MQAKTFTQKLTRQTRVLSCFLSLLALVSLLGTQTAHAQVAFSESRLTVTGAPTIGTFGPGTYWGAAATGSTAPRPGFNGLALGNYNPVTSSLALSGVTTSGFVVDANSSITAATFLYRVYISTATVLPAYTTVVLPRTAGTGAGPLLVSTYVAPASINMLTGVTSGGTYVIEIKYIYNKTDGFGNASTLTDEQSTGVGYKSTFTVPAPIITPPNGTTTWISNTNTVNGTNWTLSGNWSNGAPNQFADAIIPDKAPLTLPTVTPQLDDPNVTYEVRNLTINGNTNAERGLIRLLGATLRIYGDFTNGAGGLLATTVSGAGNSTVVLAGGNQTITQGRIADLRIEGTGIKSITGGLEITNQLKFLSGGNTVLRTSGPNGSGGLTLLTGSPTSVFVDMLNTGSVIGETNTAFVHGIFKANRPLVQGVQQTFGNIGLSINALARADAGVFITRTTGDPFTGPVATGSVAIKRQYGVSPTNAGSLNASIVFSYLNSANTTNGAINELNSNVEANLVLFRTTNNGIPFLAANGTVNTTNQTITQTGIAVINTITASDRTRPLPVTLTSFDAKRAGANALITWQTATELNSKGYDVQVSTDGKEFRSLGFVASKAPNSTQALSYSFTDGEKNKVALRYYRLRQVDMDDKEAFSSPRTVSFEGKVQDSGSAFYPNPFTAADQLHLTLQAAVSGQATMRISDMTGHALRQQAVEVGIGYNDIAVTGLNDLKAGMYLVSITLPTGEVKNLKMVKE